MSENVTPIHIAFAGGWSAGHVTPGLALAEAMCRRDGNIRPVFFGASEGLEADLVRRCGFKIRDVAASPFEGQGLPGKMAALLRQLPAYINARHQLKEIDARLVVGLGSHISIGPVLAGSRCGIPTVVVEPNETPGLANRFLFRFVERFYVCPFFDGNGFRTGCEKVVLAGIPIRENIGILGDMERRPPGGNEPVRVLVMGGSRGAPFINRECPELMNRLEKEGLNLRVTHQAGPNGAVEPVRERYRELGMEAEVVSFCDPIAEAYRAADFAVTAAGAITLAELAVAGIPSLVIPVAETAREHQAGTARRFAAMSGCILRGESDWDGAALAAEIGSVLKDADEWKRHVEGMRAAGKKEGLVNLADDCLRLVTG